MKKPKFYKVDGEIAQGIRICNESAHVLIKRTHEFTAARGFADENVPSSAHFSNKNVTLDITWHECIGRISSRMQHNLHLTLSRRAHIPSNEDLKKLHDDLLAFSSHKI